MGRAELSPMPVWEELSSVRALVVDDEDALRLLFVARLREAAGVSSVAEAADGVAALAVARRARPQLAVLDLNMPRLDGVETALALRELDPGLPIALASTDPHDLRLRARGLGLALFDKPDLDGIAAWAEEQARALRLVRGRAPIRRRRPTPRRGSAGCSGSAGRRSPGRRRP